MSSIVETKRLRLREMTEADAEHLFQLGQNPIVMRFIRGEPPVLSAAGGLAVFRERVLPQYALGLGRWACIEIATGTYLGWCGIKHCADEGEYDLGYRFYEAHWGKGFATEAGLGVCEWARSHLTGKRVVGRALIGNLASRRVLQKIGLVFEQDRGEEEMREAVYGLRG